MLENVEILEFGREIGDWRERREERVMSYCCSNNKSHIVTFFIIPLIFPN